MDMPSYGSLPSDADTTHRLKDNGRHYVCWTRKLYDEDEVKAIAAKWSDATQVYIKTGVKIDDQ